MQAPPPVSVASSGKMACPFGSLGYTTLAGRLLMAILVSGPALLVAVSVTLGITLLVAISSTTLGARPPTFVSWTGDVRRIWEGSALVQLDEITIG